MRILKTRNDQELREIMLKIGVDPYGINIMLPKAIPFSILLSDISNISANILKQEMLSLGGDVALSRGALTGQCKRTRCLIIAELAQINQLITKLKKQPFGLNDLAYALEKTVSNYQNDKFSLRLGKIKLNLKNRTHVMGIMNITPDSFSADGLYYLLKQKGIPAVIDIAQKLIADGADIIDIGGESSRPGSKPITIKEELSRVIPLISKLSKKIEIPISIDTYKPEVAKAAINSGADLVNDISGLRSTRMAKIISRYKSAVVIMHMKGAPSTMQKNISYGCLIEEIKYFLSNAVEKAEHSGISADKIIIDPGIGFGKTIAHNLEILKHLAEFKTLNKPIMVGTSRKSFLEKITLDKDTQRLPGTIASCAWAAAEGAQIVRVHNVKAVKEGLKIIDAIKASAYA